MNNKRKQAVFEVFIFISLIAIMFVWYPNNNWKVLMGDDLIAIRGFKTNGFWGTIFNQENVQMGKVRPVSTILLYIVYKLCYLDYGKYFLINRIILVCVAYAIYFMLQNMCIKKIFSYIVAVLLITTPFSSYGVWQMIGICETFSLLCCIACLYCMSKIITSISEKDIRKYVFWCSIWFTLLVFNAERFMYLIVIFVLVILLCKRLNVKNKVLSSFLFCIPIILRTLIISMGGGNSLNTGRGEATSLISSMIAYAIQGLVNVFGFSIGVEWHGGYDFFALPPYIMIVGCFIVLFSVGILYWALTGWIREKNNDAYEIVIMYLFSFSSLFSYALVAATHGEDRFLWIPYVYLSIAIMRYFSIMIKKRKTQYLAVVCFVVVILLNGYYVKNKIHVHYRYSQEMAQTCIESVEKLIQNQDVKNICCVKPNDYTWVFDGGTFFKYYIDENVNVYFYDDFEAIDADSLGEDTIVVYPDENYTIPYGTTACWISDLKK